MERFQNTELAKEKDALAAKASGLEAQVASVSQSDDRLEKLQVQSPRGIHREQSVGERQRVQSTEISRQRGNRNALRQRQIFIDSDGDRSQW